MMQSGLYRRHDCEGAGGGVPEFDSTAFAAAPADGRKGVVAVRHGLVRGTPARECGSYRIISHSREVEFAGGEERT